MLYKRLQTKAHHVPKSGQHRIQPVEMDVVQRMKKALRRGRSVELPPGTIL